MYTTTLYVHGMNVLSCSFLFFRLRGLVHVPEPVNCFPYWSLLCKEETSKELCITCFFKSILPYMYYIVSMNVLSLPRISISKDEIVITNPSRKVYLYSNLILVYKALHENSQLSKTLMHYVFGLDLYYTSSTTYSRVPNNDWSTNNHAFWVDNFQEMNLWLYIQIKAQFWPLIKNGSLFLFISPAKIIIGAAKN